jgi:hypothetical protein
VGKEWANEHATNPPSRVMIIVCMVLPKPFAVRPSKNEYVTIHDVLAATNMEFHRAARGAAVDEQWVSGFSRPIGGLEPALLMRPCRPSRGRYEWAGLSEQCEPGTWLLHIECEGRRAPSEAVGNCVDGWRFQYSQVLTDVGQSASDALSRNTRLRGQDDEVSGRESAVMDIAWLMVGNEDH